MHLETVSNALSATPKMKLRDCWRHALLIYHVVGRAEANGAVKTKKA